MKSVVWDTKTFVARIILGIWVEDSGQEVVRKGKYVNILEGGRNDLKVKGDSTDVYGREEIHATQWLNDMCMHKL